MECRSTGESKALKEWLYLLSHGLGKGFWSSFHLFYCEKQLCLGPCGWQWVMLVTKQWFVFLFWEQLSVGHGPHCNWSLTRLLHQNK